MIKNSGHKLYWYVAVTGRNHKDDFICIRKTYLDATVAADDKDLFIEGYNLVHTDHPSNVKKGGICIYYKDSPVVQLINVNYLSVCLLGEVTFDDIKV